MTEVLDTCGCCKPPAPPTPEAIGNRPGLSSVRYRVGTYASFREAIVERAGRDPALSGWTARTDDDYGMTVIDLWSYVADILTFYQERIANEAFLRTALLRDSVVKLAGLLGYVPAPGRAAAAQLVFMLEQGKALTLHAGLKLQSVPVQDESPQKFETSAELGADASLNSIPVAGTPVTPSPAPLGSGSTGATLDPASAADLRRRLVPGDTLVAYAPSNGVVEEKRLASIEQAGAATKVAWDPALQSGPYTKLTKYRRKLRLFGHDAPATYLHPHVDPNGEVTLAHDPTPTTVADPWTLQLDAVYDDLVAGTRLLIPSSTENEAVVTTVILAYPAPAVFGPITGGTVTQIEITQAAPSGSDPRRLQLYELDDVDVDLWQFEYPGTVTGTRVLIPAALGVTVDEGRAIVLNDAAGPPHGATITAVGTTTGGLDLAVDFSPGLPSGRSLDAASATLFGNVVEATHGETVAPPQRLGTGDASVPFQRFPLAKFPVTYVRSPGALHGAASTLDLRVGGLRWHAADNFYGHGPSDRVYTQTVDDDGKTTIEFGDGVTGAPASHRRGDRRLIPQGHGQRGQRAGRHAHLAAHQAEGTAQRQQPGEGGRRFGSRDARAGASERSADRPHLRADRVAARLRGRGARQRRGGKGARHVRVGERRAGRAAHGGRRRRRAAHKPGDQRSPGGPRRAARPVPSAHDRGLHRRAGARGGCGDRERPGPRPERRGGRGAAGAARPLRLRPAGVRPARAPERGVRRAAVRHRRGRDRHQPARLCRPGARGGPRPHESAGRSRAHAGRPGRDRHAGGLRHGGDDVMTNAIDLYELLPVVYRLRDTERGLVLQALLKAVSEQADLLKDNIDGLWDDLFIETCGEWVIPYIGDLVSNTPIYEVAGTRRADVAKTIYYRRRKGTLPMLEELARDVTGWPAHAVEFFELLGWTQNLNHLRYQALRVDLPGAQFPRAEYRVGTVDIRDLNAADLIDSAFDLTGHTVDVRPFTHVEGWHGIRNVGFFLWRLESFPLSRVMPVARGDQRPGALVLQPARQPHAALHGDEPAGYGGR